MSPRPSQLFWSERLQRTMLASLGWNSVYLNIIKHLLIELPGIGGAAAFFGVQHISNHSRYAPPASPAPAQWNLRQKWPVGTIARTYVPSAKVSHARQMPSLLRTGGAR